LNWASTLIERDAALNATHRGKMRVNYIDRPDARVTKMGRTTIAMSVPMTAGGIPGDWNFVSTLELSA
jgi:hypothetical protein